MPRDGSGIYSKPFPDVVTGTTIESAVHNGTINDFATDANVARPIVAGGTGSGTVAGAQTNLQIVPSTGGTFTGDITISKASPALALNGTSGTYNVIYGKKSGVNRWLISPGDSTAEAGGTGSDFVIARYNDAGAYVGDCIFINRSTGNVGIGTTTPNTKLEVSNGYLRVSSTGGAPAAPTSGAGMQLVYDNTAGKGTLFSYDYGAAAFKATAIFGNPITLDGGNVGIGTASPGQKLTVVGNAGIQASSNALAVALAYSAARAAAGGFCYVGASDSNTPDIIFSNSTGTEVGRIDNGGIHKLGVGFLARPGTAGPYGSNTLNLNWTGTLQAWVDSVNVGTITITCDHRIKDNVTDLASTWEQVMALRPIQFNYKDWGPPQPEGTPADKQPDPIIRGSSIQQWGFIAHELQEALLPTAAFGEKDKPNELQSPNVLAVLAAVTRAVQEAMQRIEALEAA